MIRDNVERITERIHKAAAAAGRNPQDITLVGVTKTVTAQEAGELLEAGVLNLGENRVQSLLDKYEKLGNRPVWHLIGHLQTNKVKYIKDKVSLIHSVDSLRLAEEISRQFVAAEKKANILLQVNVSGEESKYGISPQELFSLAEQISTLPNISVQGLMTMAPLAATKDETRHIFSGLKKLSLDLESKGYPGVTMRHLSMGMSGDFYEAILEGATLVRIGSALFQ